VRLADRLAVKTAPEGPRSRSATKPAVAGCGDPGQQVARAGMKRNDILEIDTAQRFFWHGWENEI
jgi:hypothetical protein